MDEIFKTPFLLRVSLGVVPGCSIFTQKMGNDDIDMATVPEDLWKFGGELVYSLTADINTISSDSELDVGNNILIQGLDSSWNFVSQIAVSNGMNKVSLETPLIRSLYERNLGSALTGNIYEYVDTDINLGIPIDSTKVRGYIKMTDNRSFRSHYSVPANHVGYLVYANEGLDNFQTTSATAIWCSRLFGGDFVNQNKIALNTDATSFVERVFSTYEPIPEKTDIVVKCDYTSANNVGISGTFSVLQIGKDWIQHYR